MHELALSRAIVDAAVRHAEGRRVVKVAATIGALRQATRDSLAFCFEIVARDTLCEGAVLEPRFAPARLRCGCGEEWELEEPSFRCPRCGGEAAVLGGEELSVDSIEVEEAASADATDVEREPSADSIEAATEPSGKATEEEARCTAPQ